MVLLGLFGVFDCCDFVLEFNGVGVGCVFGSVRVDVMLVVVL